MLIHTTSVDVSKLNFDKGPWPRLTPEPCPGIACKSVSSNGQRSNKGLLSKFDLDQVRVREVREYQS